jgi:hypothetical protein
MQDRFFLTEMVYKFLDMYMEVSAYLHRKWLEFKDVQRNATHLMSHNWSGGPLHFPEPEPWKEN